MSDAPDLPSHLTIPYTIHTIAAAGPGVAEIAAERRRQVEQEGWDSDHDDHHGPGVLSRAARCYMEAAEHALTLGVKRDDPIPEWLADIPADWPWAGAWWKPTTNAERMMVKAGALLAAEIARGQRCRDQA